MTQLLLDTCVLLWLSTDPAKLSEHAAHLCKDSSMQLFISAISAFEIAIKHQKRKLKLPLIPAQWFSEVCEFYAIKEIPINSRIAIAATELPPLHADPADRLIVATACEHSLVLLSPDSLIGQYPAIRVIW